jgi:hypothetical protein
MSGRVRAVAALFGALVLAAAVASCSLPPSASKQQGWDREIARLQAEQDSLRARAAELIATDPRIQRLPVDDVVISVPTSFVRSVIERVLADVASRITLRIGGIKAHVEKSVKKIVTIGNFTVDVLVREVVGKLETKKPDVRFAADKISLALPVELNQGHGRASIHFVWDGKNVAGAACGDMDVTQEVSGNAIPSRYLITGSLGLALRGNELVATPKFPETKVRIRVTPSKASWAAIDSLLESKKGVCGYVLDKVNVPEILKGVVQEKGFNVALPLSKVKPFVIPAGVRDTLTVGDRVFTVATTSKSVRIDPDAIIYSAGVELRK